MAAASEPGRRGLPALVWCALFTLAADRLFISTGLGGGSGLLRLAWITTCGLGIAVLAARRDAWLAATDLGRQAAPFSAFLGVGALLPIVGVIMGFPDRTVVAAITPLCALSMALLGTMAARKQSSDGLKRVLDLLLIATAWLALAAGACQFLYYRLSIVALQPLLDWDQATTLASGAALVTGRATGVYVNPNTYALLGGALVVYGLTTRLRGSQQVALLLPATGILLLSQSRGVIAALLVTGLLELLRRSRRVRLSGRAPIVALVLLLSVIGAVAVLAQAAPAFMAAATSRFASLASVVVQGAGASADLAGRLGFWQAGWNLLLERPLGTLGPPEFVLGTAVDSDVVRIAVQGGFLYLGLFVGLLAWMRRAPGVSPWSEVLRALAPYIAVASLTQIPTATPVFAGVVALLAGLHVGWAAGNRTGDRGSRVNPGIT